jgi:hypothetical protein
VTETIFLRWGKILEAAAVTVAAKPERVSGAKPEKPLELPCWNCAKVSPVACPNCGQIYHQSALPKLMAAMMRGLKALVKQ